MATKTLYKKHGTAKCCEPQLRYGSVRFVQKLKKKKEDTSKHCLSDQKIKSFFGSNRKNLEVL